MVIADFNSRWRPGHIECKDWTREPSINQGGCSFPAPQLYFRN